MLILLLFSQFLQISTEIERFELILVQALWRHGDRAAQYPFKTDAISEKDWNRIGSGIGQLTYDGVRQQIDLGKSIRNRYVKSGFLSEDFDKKQVKFRSTNRNRTILSAKSNFLGMYPSDGIRELPIFIPENYAADCVNNVMCSCKRRDFLQEKAGNLEEFRELAENPEVISLFKNLSKWSGESISINNFWRIPDTLRCEKRHFPKVLEESTSWYSDELLEKLESLNTKINRFTSGIYKFQPGNIDFSKEISKIRSGPIVAEIFERMAEKLDCQSENRGKRARCSENARNLKYYAYSSHDMTLFSLLNALGLQNLTSSEIGGWPSYASSIFIELFQEKSTKMSFFRVIYRTPENSHFHNVTPKIPFCNGQKLCDFAVFQKIYENLRIQLPINQYCHVTSDLD